MKAHVLAQATDFMVEIPRGNFTRATKENQDTPLAVSTAAEVLGLEHFEFRSISPLTRPVKNALGRPGTLLSPDLMRAEVLIMVHDASTGPATTAVMDEVYRKGTFLGAPLPNLLTAVRLNY